MEPFSNIFVLCTSLSWPPHTDSIEKALQPGCGVGRGGGGCLQSDVFFLFTARWAYNWWG